MTGNEGTAFDTRLRALLMDGDVTAARELLEGLADEELRQAKRWFASSAAWFQRVDEDISAMMADQYDAWTRAYQGREWIFALCAVRFRGPRTAAGSIEWERLWPHDAEMKTALVRMLLAQPPEWVAEFADAASSARFRKWGGPTLAAVLRAAVVHHGLPCPGGDTFLRNWLAGTPMGGYGAVSGPGLAEWLAVDPLMPDVLLGFLSTGDCGSLPVLPEVIGTLVRDRVVDRASVVDHVLELLTTNQRPGSLKGLAAILVAIDLRADEVTGGLGFLLGVLASAHRAVQPVLLPMALRLAEDPDDWRAVVGVVSGRPEKAAKEQVLAALKAAGTGKEVDTNELDSLLDELGSGDDAAFSAKVDKVRSSLGLPKPGVGEVPQVLGLWELAPIGDGGVQPTRFRSRYDRDPEWRDLLSSQEPGYFPMPPEAMRSWLVNQALIAMAEETYDGHAVVEATEELLGRREFLSSAFITAFEDMFLAGGLRQSWSTAMHVAELAAGAPKRPAGMADILRFLSRYAPEVPGPSALPPHVAALAADPSRTKTAVEARVLLAAVNGAGGGTLASVGGVDHRPARAVRQGVWDRPARLAVPLPSVLPLDMNRARRAAQEPASLVDLLAQNFSSWSPSFIDVCWWPPGYGPSAGRAEPAFTEPARVLAATMTAIRRHGSDTIRWALAGIEREHPPTAAVAAIDVWARGGLDLSTFWRLATQPVVSEHALHTRWREQGLDHDDVRARLQALPAFAERLHSPVDPELGALVVPSALHAPLGRFAFLRAGEALLRAETEPDPVLLSLPMWRDGTLGAEDLLARLELVDRGSGVVGPIDLVQALHRLREVDATVVDRVPAGLRTDPVFTDPEGEQTWDATDLVQRWCALGGLPPLVPTARDGQWHGAPTSPVPFSSLAAWPGELRDDPWSPGYDVPETLSLYPRWADRAFKDAFDQLTGFDPRNLPGLAADPLGVPFHDRLLALPTSYYNGDHEEGASSLVSVAQSRQLDLEALAVAAVGRHDASTLALGHLTKIFQREFEPALRALWPVALTLAAAMAGVSRRPPQLLDLLRLLTAYAHEVPASAATVPPGLLVLAESKGSTKTHQAARELVAALRQVATS